VLPDKIGGLPAHILLVHVVIVLVPLAALMLVASALWPAARAKLGFLTPAVALVALVFVPITTHAGHWLQDHLRGNIGHTNPLILHHVALAHELLPWVLGIFVMSSAVWLLGRRFELGWRRGRRSLPVWATAVVALLSVVVAVGGVVQLYRVGEAGSHAVWSGTTTG